MYAVYSQNGAFGSAPVEFGFSRKLAMEKVKSWSGLTVTTEFDAYHAMVLDRGEIFGIIESMDTIEELLKFKYLYEDEIECLFEMGLVKKKV